MGDSYEVFYTSRALDDIENIYNYVAWNLFSLSAARNLRDLIRAKVNSLSFMPFRYAAVDYEPWKSTGMRKVPVKNFIIFYIVDDEMKTVVVIRVVYGGVDIVDFIENEIKRRERT